MPYFFLIIFILLFSWLSFKKPVWALSLTVFALPSYLIRFKILFFPTTLLEVMLLLLFIIWLFKSICVSKSLLITDKTQSPKHFNVLKFSCFHAPWRWLIIIWLIVSFIAVFVSADKVAALGIWRAYFLEPIFFFLVFISEIKTKKDLELIFYALGFSALIISLIAIYQRFTGWMVPFDYWFKGEGKRVTSIFAYPNALGLYLGPIIGLFLGKIFNIKLSNCQIVKLLYYYIVVLLSLLAIILARSEGAIIAIILSLIIFGLLIKNFRFKTLLILLTVIILFFSIPCFKNYFLEKLEFKEWSSQVRLSVWKESWQMIKDNWFFGAGLAGYQSKIISYHQAKYIEIFLYPHNIILNFWSELGILGLLTFLGLVINFFREIKKKIKCPLLPAAPRRMTVEEGIKRWWESENKSYLYGCLLATLIILIHGLVDVPYFKNDLAVTFWLIMGISYVV